MRWVDSWAKIAIKEAKNEKRAGEKRIIRKFLLFPKELKGEVRWLEYASIKQIFLEQLWSPGSYSWVSIDWEHPKREFDLYTEIKKIENE